MFNSIFVDGFTMETAAICFGVSIVLGILIALAYSYKSDYTPSFIIMLILLPSIVQAVIMMVNGNIGTGIAVAGAFSLVRFRSAPGDAKDICMIFFAIAVGIATGIGQIYFAIAFTLIILALFVLFKALNLTLTKKKRLKVTIPEDCDYEREINPVLKENCSHYNLEKVKTTNLGSLFALTYCVVIKKGFSEKKLLDEIRIKNANLPITVNAYVGNKDLL
ncbi:MAG: DUF4956 domain-containing protein [Clostridiales bacterium]|nr:DUF4956 domain-containing protein [Clostridiales bacterium]